MSLSLREPPAPSAPVGSGLDPDPVRPGARRRLVRVAAEAVLTLGALLGLVVTGITVTAARSGYQPLVVRSGSMEPTIRTGSMVLVQRVQATEIEVGDIVAVERPDRTRVTHRVVSLAAKGASVELTLKGDANEDPDPIPVTVVHADRLVLQVPQLGRTMAWLATAQGGFVLGCIVTFTFTAAVRGRTARRVRGGTRPQRQRHHGA